MNNILNDKVKEALSSLHYKTGEEWISLKEIRYEIETNNRDAKDVSDVAIKDTIDRHCKSSTKYVGPEEYILKDKMSGLCKYVHFEQIKFINNLNIGDVFTREQLMAIFKISGQAGIMKTNTLNCLVLTTSETNGIYGDSNVENGFIIYTGEGLIGNQTITKNNKTIYESKGNNLPMYLFSKDEKRRYIFEGRVELCNKPYQVNEIDINGNDRLVWKFPLAIVYPENYDFSTDDKFKKITYKITEIENKIYPEIEAEQNDLEYVTGLVNIRKYRKISKKITRSKKPDYVADEMVKNMQGIINEKKIFEQEINRLMEEAAKKQVQLMEEFFKSKKENEVIKIESFLINHLPDDSLDKYKATYKCLKDNPELSSLNIAVFSDPCFRLYQRVTDRNSNSKMSSSQHYSIKQMALYDSEAAIKHIIERHQMTQNVNDEGILFHPYIDMSRFLAYAQHKIDNFDPDHAIDIKVYGQSLCRSYILYQNNIGFDQKDGTEANAYIVVTLPTDENNKRNILTMYPVLNEKMGKVKQIKKKN